eukprot:1364499-Rhodomonas_salina.1
MRSACAAQSAPPHTTDTAQINPISKNKSGSCVSPRSVCGGKAVVERSAVRPPTSNSRKPSTPGPARILPVSRGRCAVGRESESACKCSNRTDRERK